MEEQVTVKPYIEEQKPKRVLIKNDVVLFIVIAIGAILFGTLAAYACMVTGIPYIWFSLATYALFGVLAVWLYRSALVTFRYTLSSRMLTVERVIGKKVRPEAQAHLSDIIKTAGYRGKAADGKAQKAGHGKPEEMLLVVWSVGRHTEQMLIGVSKEFEKELSVRVRQARK